MPFKEQTSGADTVRFEKDIISMKYLQIGKPMHMKLEKVMWPNSVLEGSEVCRMEEKNERRFEKKTSQGCSLLPNANSGDVLGFEGRRSLAAGKEGHKINIQGEKISVQKASFIFTHE